MEIYAAANAKTGRVDESIRAFKHCLHNADSKSVRTRTLVNIAAVQHADSRYEDAIASIQDIDDDYLKDLVRSDKDYQSVLILGESWYELGEYGMAITSFKMAPVTSKFLSGDLLEIVYMLGMSYLNSGDPRNARKAFTQVVAAKINYRDARARLSELEAE